jgi:hypothetical protein
MRGLHHHRVARLAIVAGLLVGGIAGTTGVVVGASAIAESAPATPRAVIEATHLPPLLTLPGEPVALSFDVHCAPAGVEDPEQACQTVGSVFAREGNRGAFRELPLEEHRANGLRQLWTPVPESLAASADGFEYYAVIEPADAASRVVVPAAGHAAPYRVRQLVGPVDVDLGTHEFGDPHPRSARVASAHWGNGPLDVGLEQARNEGAIGATAFDVDASGTVLLLDEAHRRLLRWVKNDVSPASVPLSIDGRLADLTIADDGSVYVLESIAAPGRAAPLVRRFDENGRELDHVETAEPTPSQIRIGPRGPVVLESPSHQWMPVAIDGAPVGTALQRGNARSGRPLRGGGEVVVLRRGNGILVALVDARGVRRSWHITSRTTLGEVQLAEPLGRRFLLVARVYSESRDEFVVLILDRHGLVERFSVDPAEWAEAAPLGRFRLVGGALYRLGSSSTGAFVDRFDLEVH